MATITLWFMLGTAGMGLGTLALLGALTRLESERRRTFALVVAVPAIAFVAYGLMALGIGAVTGARGNVLYVPRYVDWLLTTPIHVLFLGLLAGVERRTVARTMTLQGATIVLGLLGALLATPLNWLLYLVGSATFLVVIRDVYGPFARSAKTQTAGIADLFRKLRAFVVVLWLVYPLIWALAPAGIGAMDTETTSLVISYIDVVAKVGFGLIAFNGYRSLVATARAERARGGAEGAAGADD